jgi:peptide/nickel transport system substrate-binding protein
MRHSWRAGIGAAAIALVVAAACGGETTPTQPAAERAADEPDDAVPRHGGKVVYGVEADVGGGFCLPEAEHAISGWLVDMSVYDPLVYPNEDGELVPYLAESVTSNAAATKWTIELRDGITFHDGSALDAEVVKLNLDAYRGHETVLSPLLWAIVLQDIADVRVTGPLTVVVTTKRPWVSLPWFLFSTGRMGMMGRAQLEDEEQCPRNLIGTGPFRLAGSWTPGRAMELERNPDHWRTDEHGAQLPYLDELTFQPVPEPSQRINQLEGGQLQAMHTSKVSELDRLQGDARFEVVTTDRGREVNYYLLNAGRPPFDDIDARRAFAAAVDIEAMNALRNQGTATLANGPFDVGVPGHVDELPVNERDLDEARALVEQVKARNGGRFDVTFVVNPDTGTQAEAEILKQQVEEAGITVALERVDQPTEINRGLGGDFDVLFWRLHPGEDPDTQYTWWYGGYPTNFNHFADPELDRLLDLGRASTDEAERVAAYEDVNRRFSEQQYNVWKWYTDWTVATSADVHGVLGPELPDGSAPFPLLAGLHPTLGIWIEE